MMAERCSMSSSPRWSVALMRQVAGAALAPEPGVNPRRLHLQQREDHLLAAKGRNALARSGV
jgi:hypothetical protein